MREIVVTNRHLCKDFWVALERALAQKPYAVVLREKDLSRDEYISLAFKVNALCENHGVMFIPHTFEVPGVFRLHLPFHLASKEYAENFHLSLSIHSVEEAQKAQALGANFVVAGHIFETKSKPELKPRGLDFLYAVCKSVDIPVFAIGGISSENAQSCMDVGAAGVCKMSCFMEG